MKNHTFRNLLLLLACSAMTFSIGYSKGEEALGEEVLGRKPPTQRNAMLAQKEHQAERNASCMRQNYIYSNRYIADSIGYFFNIGGDTIRIGESDSGTLICRISERHGKTATNYAVDLARSSGYGNVIYLADNRLTLNEMSQTFGISEEKLYATTTMLSDADNQPFPYFLFARGGKIKAIYIPLEANDGPDLEMISQMITSAAQ